MPERRDPPSALGTRDGEALGGCLDYAAQPGALEGQRANRLLLTRSAASSIGRSKATASTSPGEGMSA